MAGNEDIILHQYKASPFSEKVRLALLLKNLAWTSVEVPNMMPKPLLTPLTGGYRRTPVMQIGADIYCDTAIILRELEKRFPRPSLVTPGHEGLHAMVAGWTDRVWFQTSVGVIFGAIGDHIPEAFKNDRAALSGRKFDTDAMKAAAPMLRDQWRSNLSWVEERLAATSGAGAGAWLLGARPGLVDVHVHMNIWFAHMHVKAFVEDCFQEAPRTLDWFTRLNEPTGQTPSNIDGEAALDIASNASPRLLAATTGTEPQGLVPGEPVAVAPDDYGKDWVQGELVYSGANRIVIQRVDKATGPLHVHFPRAGFLVRRIGEIG